MNEPAAPEPQARGFLVTFRPCGDVQHMTSPPKQGQWMTHWRPRKACQASGQVTSVEPCPGCPDCPGWTPPWEQPSLFSEPEPA